MSSKKEMFIYASRTEDCLCYLLKSIIERKILLFAFCVCNPVGGT